MKRSYVTLAAALSKKKNAEANKNGVNKKTHEQKSEKQIMNALFDTKEILQEELIKFDDEQKEMSNYEPEVAIYQEVNNSNEHVESITEHLTLTSKDIEYPITEHLTLTSKDIEYPITEHLTLTSKDIEYPITEHLTLTSKDIEYPITEHLTLTSKDIEYPITEHLTLTSKDIEYPITEHLTLTYNDDTEYPITEHLTLTSKIQKKVFVTVSPQYANTITTSIIDFVTEIKNIDTSLIQTVVSTEYKPETTVTSTFTTVNTEPVDTVTKTIVKTSTIKSMIKVYGQGPRTL